MSFRYKTVLITGAASGIGRAMSLQLSGQGARVGIIDRDEAGLEQLRVQLKQNGARSAVALADVTRREAIQAAVLRVTSELGPADVLIPCAGICGFETVDDLNMGQAEQIMQVNFFGVVYAVEAVLPSMLERGSGSIAAVASLAGVGGIPFEASYGASKAALATYFESLRPPLRRRGVRVTVVYPGYVQTPLLDGLMATGLNKPPVVVNAETSSRKILAAVASGNRSVSFPWRLSVPVWLGRMMPPFFYDWVMTRMSGQVKLPY